MKKTILAGIIILVFVGLGLFYWYQVRPLKIRIECGEEAHRLEEREFNPDYPACYYEPFYRKCLKEKGLK